MKKIFPVVLATALLAGCISYRPVPKVIDSQKLPALALVDSPSEVKVVIDRTFAVVGLPDQTILTEKSQYVVPLPFVGFSEGSAQ